MGGSVYRSALDVHRIGAGNQSAARIVRIAKAGTILIEPGPIVDVAQSNGFQIFIKRDWQEETENRQGRSDGLSGRGNSGS